MHDIFWRLDRPTSSVAVMQCNAPVNYNAKPLSMALFVPWQAKSLVLNTFRGEGRQTITSFFLSMICKQPTGLTRPISPVANQPSVSKTAAVSSGCL